jgi:hypothetical protein
MRDSPRTLVVVLLIGLLLAGTFLAGHGALAQGSGFAVEWWVVAGGGAFSRGSGGEVVLQDTLGQPIVGPSSGNGGQVTLGAGYWTGSAPLHRIYLPLVLRQ